MQQLLEGPHTILCHHCSCCLPFLGSGGFGGLSYDPGTLVTLTVLCLGRARCSFLSSGLQAPVCSDSALLPLQHSGMTSARVASLTHAPHFMPLLFSLLVVPVLSHHLQCFLPGEGLFSSVLPQDLPILGQVEAAESCF